MSSELVIAKLELYDRTFAAAAYYRDRLLTDLRLDPMDQRTRVGTVYAGYVEKIISGLKCAFVRIDANTSVYVPLTDSGIRASDKVAVRIKKEATTKKQPYGVLVDWDGLTKVGIGSVLKKPEPFYECLRPSDTDTVIKTDIPRYAEEEEVDCYDDPHLSLSALKGLDHEAERLLKKEVHLKSGGSLVIERTEAFTAIDVNSGRSIKDRDRAKLRHLTNTEALHEAARQIRLRNLSGIILIDLINERTEEEKEELLATMKEATAKDPVKTDVVDLTSLWILEITRKAEGRPLDEIVRL